MMEAETETDPNYMSVDDTAPVSDDIATQHDKSAVMVATTDRSIGGTVGKIACGFMLANILHYISVACAVVSFIGGGVLVGVGTTLTMTELRYVSYGFGAAVSVIALFFAFRSFSLALALRDLQALREQMQDTVTDLRKVNTSLDSSVELMKKENMDLKQNVVSLHTTADELQKTNASLRATADGMTDMLASMEADGAEMRKQIAALTECNERFRTAIGALVTAGSQSADLTKMINDSLQSIKQLETNLQDERKRQEAFTTHLTAAILAQMDGNGDGSIDAIEQQKWLGKLAQV